MGHAFSGIAAAFLLAFGASASAADPPALITEEFTVDADTPGVRLYVRNKHPADMSSVPTGHVLLYVHGATQPSEATFDLPLGGRSWMDHIAAQGWDVYMMDARGYGASTRSPELLQPDAAKAPMVTTAVKVRDLSAVVGFVLKRRGIERLALLGWSWGTTVAGAYAADHPDQVTRLVLFAPVWCDGPCRYDSQSATDARIDEVGPVVEATMEGARTRMQSGVPPARRDELLPADWFAAWSNAALGTDPIGSKKDPPAIRVPAGIREDSDRYWNQGNSTYDPAKIVAPTLVVVAEWDEVTPPGWAKGLYDMLVHSADRRFVELKEGSHMILLEKNRMSLFETVQAFIDPQP